MQRYELFVIKESRVLLAIMLLVLSILLSLELLINTEHLILKIAAPFLLLSSTTVLAIYSTFSKLLVNVRGNQIEFHWARKLLFNFSSVKKINLESIEYLVIDKDSATSTEFLRSIWINNSKIALGLGKIRRYDADLFIDFLKQNSPATVIDSWDTWKKLGLLKGAYMITAILIYGIPAAIVYLLISKDLSGIEVHKWLYLTGSYLAFIPAWLTLKSKLNN